MRTMLICLLAILAVGSVMASSPATPLDQLLEQYFLIHKSLASDSTGGIRAVAAGMEKISRQAPRLLTSAAPEICWL